MNSTKAWDWSKNKDQYWLIPSMDSAYLAEDWAGKGLHRFLDLGCGLGRHSLYMAVHGFDVTAVDLSGYGMDYLQAWAKEENRTIKSGQSNMLALPFADHSFDCVMAYNVIYHTDTQGFVAALAEIRRVLHPNGELYLTLISKNTWSYQHAEHYRRVDENTILRDGHETEKDVPHFYVDIQDIKRLFAGWIFIKAPIEWCEYNLEKPEYYSKHWTLMVRPG